MRIYHVIGKERMTGVFNGSPYDNVMVYTTSDPQPTKYESTLEGIRVKALKFKSEFVSIDDVIVGNDYHVLFDQYKNPAAIIDVK